MRKISKREPVWTGCVERSPRMGTCTVLQGIVIPTKTLTLDDVMVPNFDRRPY